MEWEEVILADLKIEIDRSRELEKRSRKFRSCRNQAWSDSSPFNIEREFEKISTGYRFAPIEQRSDTILVDVPDLAGGRNKKQNLEVKIPVYVAYFTAWPDENGLR